MPHKRNNTTAHNIPVQHNNHTLLAGWRWRDTLMPHLPLFVLLSQYLFVGLRGRGGGGRSKGRSRGDGGASREVLLAPENLGRVPVVGDICFGGTLALQYRGTSNKGIIEKLLCNKHTSRSEMPIVLYHQGEDNLAIRAKCPHSKVP